MKEQCRSNVIDGGSMEYQCYQWRINDWLIYCEVYIGETQCSLVKRSGIETGLGQYAVILGNAFYSHRVSLSLSTQEYKYVHHNYQGSLLKYSGVTHTGGS